MIAVTRNRFTVETWPKVKFVDRGALNVACDFFVYLGENVELKYHPDTLVLFRQNEPCGVILENDSIHATRPDFPGMLGHPEWRDDFFVLKYGKYAVDFLELWRKSMDVTETVFRMGVPPCMYPSQVIKVHCPLDDEPSINYGLE